MKTAKNNDYWVYWVSGIIPEIKVTNLNRVIVYEVKFLKNLLVIYTIQHINNNIRLQVANIKWF